MSAGKGDSFRAVDGEKYRGTIDRIRGRDCPYCDNGGLVIGRHADDVEPHPDSWVECDWCRSTPDSRFNKRQAFELWKSEQKK